MKTFWVVNPNSAHGQTGKRWPGLAAQVRSQLGAFGQALTGAPMHAAKLCGQALRDGYDCVVAVGGDGTLNEVVNGFFDERGSIHPSAALAVLPCGTGGDFRRSFGWDTEVASALERILRPGHQALDVGLLEFTSPEGVPAKRYFANICSFGVSGLVDQAVSRGSRALGGKLSFMLGSARALLKYADKRVQVRLDGGAPETVPVTTLAVANGRFFGGGMCVAPSADPSDGIFDVTLWSGYGLSDFILKSRALYSGRHTELRGTRTLRCRVLEAESSEEVLLDVDGEQPGRLPCRMTLLPGVLRLKV